MVNGMDRHGRRAWRNEWRTQMNEKCAHSDPTVNEREKRKYRAERQKNNNLKTMQEGIKVVHVPKGIGPKPPDISN